MNSKHFTIITGLTPTVADGGSNRRPSTLEPGASFTLDPAVLATLTAKARLEQEISDDYTWLERRRDEVFLAVGHKPLQYACLLVSAIQTSANVDADRETPMGYELGAIARICAEAEAILSKVERADHDSSWA